MRSNRRNRHDERKRENVRRKTPGRIPLPLLPSRISNGILDRRAALLSQSVLSPWLHLMVTIPTCDGWKTMCEQAFGEQKG